MSSVELDDELETFTNRYYGDYFCACGCGQPLQGMCYSVGRKDDEEGYEWRTFTPECWERLSAEFSPAELYEMFDTNESL